ncbi:MAG: hypothetical protein GC154_20005 [bacterium]|nr:hypothetical protein [bacterium]
MSATLTIGNVAFSNTLPLVHYLPEFLPGAQIIHEVPSRLGPMLARGELDVAMLSSIELLRDPGYGYVPGLGVCSDGPVRSVLLWTRRPPERAETVALDGNSLSSRVLTRILFSDLWRNRPRFITYTPPVTNGLAIADAALTIGDNSFDELNDESVSIVDLGQAWKDLTGLPFVFAVWITRPGLDPASIAEPFQAALEKSLRNVDELTGRYARPDGAHGADFFKTYFTRDIRYRLGEREREGLALYLNKAESIVKHAQTA